MEFSRKTDYALRAMVELAAVENEAVSTTELAKRTEVPHAFMAKILAELSSHRLVELSRGRAGGARIAVDPGETTALRVIEAVSGALNLNRCVTKPDSCPRHEYCSVHDMWSAASTGLRKSLSVDLRTLAASQRRKRESR